MPRRSKSQWEFGELFEPAPATRKVYSVAELTGGVRRLLEKEFGRLWVTGEVSNLRTQSSGHSYFTLKDGSSQLSCVLFRGEARDTRRYLEDGQKVILQGDLTVYEPRGQYQLRVVAVELQGVGALQLAFEKLKRTLQAEGLFAVERKQPLPSFPQRIGLVTSPTGAAIRDVLHVIERRYRGLEIVLASCRVQGPGAAAEIAAAVTNLNAWSARSEPGLDLILVTRGGGSLEDLWAFNEEVVARAVFYSALPVVSAVGHEIDFTICDFVADVRAATPSAAAEIITEGMFSCRPFLAGLAPRMSQLARQRWAREEEALELLRRRLGRLHPKRVIQDRLQLLDDLHLALLRAARLGMKEHTTAWANLRSRLTRIKPGILLDARQQALTEQSRRMRENVLRRMTDWQIRLAALRDRLRLLSPDNVLARGYSITSDEETGRLLRAAQETRPGQRLVTRLHEGSIRSTVD